MHEHIRIYDTVPLNTGESKYDLLTPYGDDLNAAMVSLFEPSLRRDDLSGINTVMRLLHIPAGHVSDKMDDQPYIVPFLADGCRKCVIIAPGGAYSDVSMDNEGYPTAEFLQSHGVSAFVLKYRVWPYRYPAAFLDLRRAICYVKAHAAEFGIDPEQVSVMGFSAGGNLVTTTALLFEDLPKVNGYEPDEVDCRSARVASVAAIYPEVLGDKHLMAFQFGERVLKDEAYAEEICRKNYLPQYVKADSPAMFLCACRDDTVVDPRNVLEMALAAQRAGINYELHLFTEGGHGFGATQEDIPPMYGHNGFNMAGTRDWIRHYITWLNKSV